MKFSDSQLVPWLRVNDRAAFEEVVERYYQSVYRQLWHLCGDAETAAD
jgi:DNA-directed RNA polymerase specialized sigma24 family protein